MDQIYDFPDIGQHVNLSSFGSVDSSVNLTTVVSIAFNFVLLTTIVIIIRKMNNIRQQKEKLKLVRIPTFDPSTEINGVFEIHITIKSNQSAFNYINLLEYCRNNQGIKPILACSTIGNNQYMISHYTRKTNANDAVQRAIEIANDMQKYSMEIDRVKVEAQNITGISGLPITDDDFKQCAPRYNNPYFEFHIKISNSTTYNLDVARFNSENVRVNVSFNLLSKNMLPLLTIRIYNMGFLNAQTAKDSIINSLKHDGLIFVDCAQQEFSIYDSNPNLDKGWLIE